MMTDARQIKIEKAAAAFREECNIIGYGLNDIFEAAEKKGFRVIRYPVDSKSVLGLAMIKDDERIIYSNSAQILARENFTIAHEIGHHKLHLTSQGMTVIRDNDFIDRDENETEANYFAACLLMPKDLVEKFIRLELSEKPFREWTGLDVARIQTAFCVSYDMALLRLRIIFQLKKTVSDYLESEKIERTASKLLSEINGNLSLCRPSEAKRIPSEFFDWVTTNYKDKLIPRKSVDKQLNYIGLSADDLLLPPEEEEEESDNISDLLRGMD